MLELIIILQMAVGKPQEALITSFLLVFNAIAGFTQENKAKKIIAILRQKLQFNHYGLKVHRLPVD